MGDDASPDDPISQLRTRLRDRRSLRDRLLIAVYRLTDGVAGLGAEACSIETLADELGADAGDVLREAQRLDSAGLLDFPVMAPLVVLTPDGLEHVEQMIEPTGDALQILDVVEMRHVEAFAHKLDQALDDGQVEASADTLEEIRDLLQTLQLQAKRPRRGIVRATLAIIGQLLLGASGNGVYELAKHMPVIV
jgi:hypothetical protein